MKICFLSHITNYHTKKWCKYFVEEGHEVHVISFEPGKIDGVTEHIIDIGINRNGSDIHKLKYISTGKDIKKIIKKIEPDVINVHFATSYGIACALSGVKKYILSVWGYDVYDFPNKSIFHKMILKYSLNRASLILSTSKAMKIQTKKFTNKEILITPFGVDTDIFKPNQTKVDIDNNKFTVGIVKLLSPIYGIDVLINAFKLFVNNNKDIECELRIAGIGPEEKRLKEIAKELDVSDKIVWLGYIEQSKVVDEINGFDVVVIPSFSESFGVSAVEAQACEVPVIVSNVGGLTESTNPGESSIVVEPGNPLEIEKALSILLKDKELRHKMGKNGRKYVVENFQLKNNFKSIEKIYKEFINNN